MLLMKLQSNLACSYRDTLLSMLYNEKGLSFDGDCTVHFDGDCGTCLIIERAYCGVIGALVVLRLLFTFILYIQ